MRTKPLSTIIGTFLNGFNTLYSSVNCSPGKRKIILRDTTKSRPIFTFQHIYDFPFERDSRYFQEHV